MQNFVYSKNNTKYVDFFQKKEILLFLVASNLFFFVIGYLCRTFLLFFWIFYFCENSIRHFLVITQNFDFFLCYWVLKLTFQKNGGGNLIVAEKEMSKIWQFIKRSKKSSQLFYVLYNIFLFFVLFFLQLIWRVNTILLLLYTMDCIVCILTASLVMLYWTIFTI